MKELRGLLFITTFAFLFTIGALAATPANDIYIANTAQGGGSGADCADALAYSYFNASGNWVSGTPSGNQIGPGTTVHVCGTISGGPGSTILSFQGSGTSSAPITLLFENGAQLTAPYCGSVGNGQGCITVSNPNSAQSYVVVDGGTPCGWTPSGGSEASCNGSIVMTASGASLGNQSGSALGVEVEACSHCEVRNLGIYNTFVAVQGSSYNNTNISPSFACIKVSGSNNLIHDNRMHDAGWCMQTSYSNGDAGNQYYNNEIYNIDHGFSYAGNHANDVAGPVYYYGNYIHDYEVWDTSDSTCGNHEDGIHIFAHNTSGTYDSNAGTVYIYNNYFNDGGANCKTGHLFLPKFWTRAGTGTAYIFNNVAVTQTYDGNGIFSYSSGNGTLIINNDIIDQDTSLNGILLNWSNITPTGASMTFKNNVFSGPKSFESADVSGADTGITADYNVYANNAAVGGCWMAFQSGTCNFANYQSNSYGQEQHSVANLTTTLGLNLSWLPQTGSIVIGAGANLTNICAGQPTPGLGALCSDAAGNPRPVSGSWDSGAYAYGSGGSNPPPAPPTGLTAILQ